MTYVIEVMVDGQKAAGIEIDKKPSVVLLKLIKTEQPMPVVTVLGTKEIVVP